MKNVAHPNMFPTAGESVAIASAEPTARQKPVVTDADVGGIEAAPAPSSAWSNPLFKGESSGGEQSGKPLRWADRVIAYVTQHGPTSSHDLCVAFGLNPAAGINPYVSKAVADGRLARDRGIYSLPAASSGAAGAAPSANAAPAAVSHFEAATAIVGGRKKAKSAAAHPGSEPAAAAALANLPVSANEAAAAIAAMRQPAETEPEPSSTQGEPPPLPICAPGPAVTPSAPNGRKPDFVVFVGDVQLLSWPDGDITIQTENCTVDRDARHFRALLTLVELRNDFSVVSRRL